MKRRFFPFSMVWAFLLLAVVVVFSGVWFYEAQEQKLQHKAETVLQGIAQSKIDAIVRWRQDNLARCSGLIESPLIIDSTFRIIRQGDPVRKDQILQTVRKICQTEGYQTAILVDLEGRTHLRLRGDPVQLPDDMKTILRQAVHERRAVLTELHFSVRGGIPHLDIIAPLFRSDGTNDVPFGALIFRIDAHTYLYPLIQSSPIPTDSGETILIRRDAEGVLFLNELRFAKGAALKKREQLADKNSLGSMAVSGYKGLVRARDYRGVDVLASIQPIPGSPWFMVTKVDASELFDTWRRYSLLIVATVIGLLLLLAVAAAMIWQRYEKDHYQLLLRAQKGRFKSEQRARVALMSIGDGVVIVNASGRVVLMNPVAERLMGCAESEARGKPADEVFRMIDEVTRAPLENPLTHVLRQGGVVNDAYDAVLLSRSGEEYPVSESAAPLHDAQGGVDGAMLVFRDQTKERAARKALRDSEAWFRAMFYSISEGVVTAHRQGAIFHMNQAAEALTGWTEGDARGKPLNHVLQVVDERTGLTLYGPDGSAIDGRTLPGVAAHASLISRDATSRPVAYTVSPIYGDDSDVMGVTLVFRDQTAEKMAAESLRKSEQQFRGLFETMTEAVALHEMIYDESGMPVDYVILDVNPAFFPHTGARREKMAGKKVSELLGWGNIPFLQLFHEVATGGGPRRVEGYVEGLKRYYRVSVFSPAVNRFATIFEDITDRMREEEERAVLEDRLRHVEKMQAIGILAGGIAHDLNNVLGVSVGYAELLMDELEEDHTSREYASQIMKAGERAALVVQDLLTLSRRGVPTPVVVSLNRTVLDYLETPEYDDMLRVHPKVQVRTELADDLLNIKGSPVHLGKMFSNLILYAVESVKGEGAVMIRTENRYVEGEMPGLDDIREGSYAVLSVSDSGEGISASDLKRIFEPFYAKKIMGRTGMGLGLSVVWGTVQDHNGYIDVGSEPGQGTHFTLYFPVTAEEILDQASEPDMDIGGGGEKILVVDDVQEQRDLAAQILRKLGYEVVVVSSGEEGVEYLEKYSVDLVMLDMIMDPGIDGLETYRRMLAIRPDQKALVVSGYADKERIKETLARGAGGYVKKPYAARQIGRAIKEVLTGSAPLSGRHNSV